MPEHNKFTMTFKNKHFMDFVESSRLTAGKEKKKKTNRSDSR